MDSNPICYPSPTKKMKCLFLDYVQLLMICWAGQWIQTPSTTHLQPKEWNAHFWITFNFWWSAVLVNGLEPHLPPLSNQKNDMLIFGLRSTSYDWPGWSMVSNPICNPSPTKKMKCSFLDYVQLLMISQFNFWWLARLVKGLQPHLQPLSNQKMKCSFLYYVQILVISRAGRWTRTPFATLLQPKKWNACFVLCSNSDDQPGWLMDSNPIHHLSPAKEWNAHFWITFNFWWLARLVDGLKPHLLPLSSQKNEMLVFGLCSTFDDWPGWSMDSNPIHNPSPTKKMKCLFLDYVQLLMIGQAGQWTRTPSATPLQPKKWKSHFWIMFNFWWLARLVNGCESHLAALSSQKNENLIFGLCSTSDDQLGWLMDSNITCHPTPTKKMKYLFLDYVQLLMIGQVGWWTQTPSATPLQPKKWNSCFWIMFNFWWLARLVNGLKSHPQSLSNQKNEMLVFGLCLTSDDWPRWSMESNPICNPSPTKKMKCLFLDYVQLLMIGQASRWMQIPFGSPLQPKKWKSHFWIMFNFWWSAGLVDGLKPHLPPHSNQKNEILVFVLRSTSDDGLGCLMD